MWTKNLPRTKEMWTRDSDFTPEEVVQEAFPLEVIKET